MVAPGLAKAPTFGIGEEPFEDDTDFEIDWVLVYDFSDTGMWPLRWKEVPLSLANFATFRARQCN